MSGLPESGRRELADLAATRALGEDLGAALGPGDVVILSGPLGAGKTSLTQGLAAALGVRGRVTSPTFQLARRHPPGEGGGPGLVHVDAYRLRGEAGESAEPGAARAADADVLADELEALDLDAYLDTDVVVIEWGDVFGELLAERPWRVSLERNDALDTRSARWERLERFPAAPTGE